jgi:hypothetical protein
VPGEDERDEQQRRAALVCDAEGDGDAQQQGGDAERELEHRGAEHEVEPLCEARRRRAA